MIELLENNPLLLLFAIAALGYLLGQLRFGGVSLGVSAVLFSALFFGALSPRMRVPEIIQQLGLAIFLYLMGLSSGRQFFASLRGPGFRESLFAAAAIVFAAVVVALVTLGLGFGPAGGTGLFTGSFTNAASLAAVREFIKGTMPPDLVDALVNGPTVSFSIGYPLGIVVTLVVIVVAEKIFRINYAQEAETTQGSSARRQIASRTVRVTQPAAIGHSLARIMAEHPLDIIVGRVRHEDDVVLATGSVVLREGDLLTVVGGADDLDRFQALIGELSDIHLELERHELDYRRIFVSNPRVAGRTLSELNLPKVIGAVVTRVRRGDADMIARGDMRLELGDRVRVVARREDLAAAAKFFGDSYRALSEVDVLTFNIGLALGVLAGFVAIPLPGGITLRLGIAGGPLLVSLVLGALERSGPLVWGLPYNANLTLRQFGLVLFLAGVGSGAGYDLARTIASGDAVVIALAAAGCIVVVQALILFVGYKIMRIPMGRLIGILAAIMTQPGLLAFVEQRAGDDRPAAGYAQAYPMSLIAKIIVAQVLMSVLLSLAAR
ncbi:MAG: TrkA C-terminal domain-containing protein [Thermoflexales bacterium]